MQAQPRLRSTGGCVTRQSSMLFGRMWPWSLLPGLVSLLLLLLLLPTVTAGATNPACNASAPGPRGDVVNVAILVWTPPPPDPRSAQVEWGNRSPLQPGPGPQGWNGSTPIERRVLQAWTLFEETLRARSPLPGVPALRMADGGTMRINISYYGVGPFAALRGNDEYSDVYQNSTQHALIRQLADPNGTYGRVHFILTPMSSNTPLSILVSLACEKTRTCIAVGTVRDIATHARAHEHRPPPTA
jgi:hypothetical protein